MLLRCFTTALLLLYYCFTTEAAGRQSQVKVLYYSVTNALLQVPNLTCRTDASVSQGAFTTSLLLLYYCFTTALLQVRDITCRTDASVTVTFSGRKRSQTVSAYVRFPDFINDQGVCRGLVSRCTGLVSLRMSASPISSTTKV